MMLNFCVHELSLEKQRLKEHVIAKRQHDIKR